MKRLPGGRDEKKPTGTCEELGTQLKCLPATHLTHLLTHTLGYDQASVEKQYRYDVLCSGTRVSRFTLHCTCHFPLTISHFHFLRVCGSMGCMTHASMSYPVHTLPHPATPCHTRTLLQPWSPHDSLPQYRSTHLSGKDPPHTRQTRARPIHHLFQGGRSAQPG